MKIGAQTRCFAVLGHPVGHSLSPAMHNAVLRALNMDAVYLAFDVEPDRLGTVLPALAALGFAGVNLTVPLKERAFAWLDDCDASARDVQAVNTITFTPDGLRGYNTDGYGILASLDHHFGPRLAGAQVLILGAGGAARGVALACARGGPARLTIGGRSPRRAGALADWLRTAHPELPVNLALDPQSQTTAAREADLIIQATPVGLGAADPSLLPPAAFRPGQHVMDLIYNPSPTAFLRTARAAGAQTADGLAMLAFQGERSFEIWTGLKPPTHLMLKTLQEQMPTHD